MDERLIFYGNIVAKVITDRQASILVCGGGIRDKETFDALGFLNVTISNLDSRMESNQYKPYGWIRENISDLSLADNEYDYVVVHAALHHCRSPHRALTEMYRVARRAVLAFEARDSAVMRILENLNLTQTYECTAVFFNDCKFGGVENSDVPNFVFRWTEREVRKTIQSYNPVAEHKIRFFYATGIPSSASAEKKGLAKRFFLSALKPFYILFVRIFPKQQNLFAFYIEKPILPDDLFEWLQFNQITGSVNFNSKWAHERYIQADGKQQK